MEQLKKYRRKSPYIEAFQADKDIVRDTLTCKKGDYVVIDENGNEFVYSELAFNTFYEEIPGDDLKSVSDRVKENGELFYVIDNKTGKEADPEVIALTEEWANGLIYCDMEGFAVLGEDGRLFLLDECGRCEECDPERFTVVWNTDCDDCPVRMDNPDDD